MQVSDSDGRTEQRIATASPQTAPAERLTLYHGLVMLLASCGWLFDCMGQRIFVLSRGPAMRELLGAAATDGAVTYWGGWATAALMIGWGTGGILFGTFSDRYGRVKAMVTTLVSYSVFSALAGFAHSPLQFVIYRFLFGLGVGGMFGSATTLIAESVPRDFRTMALGSMQALSALGNMFASFLGGRILPEQENVWGHWSGWQVLSFASVFPVLFAVPMLFLLKEPEPWKAAKAAAARGGTAKAVGSIADLFKHPRWRRSTIVGICLGFAGMVGLWGIGFFSPELITTAFKNRPLQVEELVQPGNLCLALKSPGNPAIARLKGMLAPEVVTACEQAVAGPAPAQTTVIALVRDLNRIMREENLYDATAFQGISLKKHTLNLVQRVQQGARRADITALNRQLVEQLFPGAVSELQKTIGKTRSWGMMLQDVGSLLGMFGFTFAAAYFSRRTAFLGSFLLCLCSVSYVFYSLKTAADVNWMMPLIGFATLSCFAGYSIYFPEIFPTRLRGTGVSFCYNVVRYLAAGSPYLLGCLALRMSFRTAAVLMSSVYLVGIIALLWAPETKGKPLPED